MVILTQNVRTKAGLLPAGTDVEGKLSNEVVEDLIKSGLARNADKKEVAEVESNASDSSNDTETKPEQTETEQSDAETTETSEQVEESTESEDSVELNLPDTNKPATTGGRVRRKGK